MKFSFLTTGPTFAFEPDDASLFAFEATSPLFNGVGGRSFTYKPKALDSGVGTGNRRLETLVDRDGRSVELWEREEPPQLWWLRWTLSSGFLYTHLREEDGVSLAHATVRSLAITEGADHTTPRLLPEKPLTVTASAVNGFQESVTFVRQISGMEIPSKALYFSRPGFLREGQAMKLKSSGSEVIVRAGLPYGIEVFVSGQTEPLARKEAESVVKSFGTSGASA